MFHNTIKLKMAEIIILKSECLNIHISEISICKKVQNVHTQKYTKCLKKVCIIIFSW